MIDNNFDQEDFSILESYEYNERADRLSNLIQELSFPEMDSDKLTS